MVFPLHKSLAIAAVLCLTFAGCSTRNGVIGFDTKRMNLGPRKRMAPIAKIICVWKAAQGQDMKNLPCRGMAGQILFMQAGSDEPVKIDGRGKVVVYVFDDKGASKDRAKPIHKFEFPIDAWNLHYSDNDQLGPSYNVFIPYTRKSIYKAKMSACVRFVPETGQLASSTIDSVTLPGPVAENEKPVLVHDVTSRKGNGLKTAVSTFNKPGGSGLLQKSFDLSRRAQQPAAGPSQIRQTAGVRKRGLGVSETKLQEMQDLVQRLQNEQRANRRHNATPTRQPKDANANRSKSKSFRLQPMQIIPRQTTSKKPVANTVPNPFTGSGPFAPPPPAAKAGLRVQGRSVHPLEKTSAASLLE